jgi:hypothetical protein
MVDKFDVLAYSFLQGTDRTVERRMWYEFYAQQVDKPLTVKTIPAAYSQMVIYGQAATVLASALTARGIEDVVRPLAFDLSIAINFVVTPDISINSAESFFANVLTKLFGLEPIKDVKKIKEAVWVIVDPDLLSSEARQQIATLLKGTGQQVLIIMREGELVPTELRDLAVEGNNEAFGISTLTPFASPMTEEALMSKKGSSYIVLGGGPRLLPTMVGVADTLLQNMQNLTGKVTNEIRAQALSEVLYYAPFGFNFERWCNFDEAWYTGESTLKDALAAYLYSLHFGVAEVQPDALNPFDSQGEFTIAPYWIPV